jgi:16S rRNA (cytosine967-C5)-methyltransferase
MSPCGFGSDVVSFLLTDFPHNLARLHNRTSICGNIPRTKIKFAIASQFLFKSLALTWALRQDGAMKKAGLNTRVAVLEVLEAVLRQKHSLDQAFDNSEKIKSLEIRDRAFARSLIATTLRRLGQIDDLISKCLNKPLGKKARRAEMLLRIGVCQLVFMGTAEHAAISTTVELAQRLNEGPYKKMINAVLRKIQRESEELLRQQDVVKLMVPEWLWTSWKSAYGETVTRDIAEAHLLEPMLDISCKSDPVSWAEKLDGELLTPGTVRRPSGGNIRDLPGFAEGAWWIQDVAARMAVSLLGDVQGKYVIDLCAAPGGKTLFLANAGAEVTAVDRSENRLKRVHENLGRLNLEADVITADVVNWRPTKQADYVLLDAPCSATGTLRRHPDVAYLKSQSDVDKLSALQSRLLDAAADMVVPTGIILFCTCSLQPEEGPDQIAAFLSRNQNFRLDRIEGPEIFTDQNPSGMFRSLPSDMKDQGGRDGFFAARLQRI